MTSLTATSLTATSLEGRVALVTGVTSGIGRALTGALLDSGARVLGVGRNDARLAAVTEGWSDAFTPVLADLSDPAARLMVAQAGRDAGVEILVNNAAVCVYANPTALAPERWRELLEVNLLAAVELAAGLGPTLPPGGHIINISSVTARHLAHPRFGPYAVSKAALEAFTEALRLEMTARQVAVSLVVPGLVDTPIYKKVDGFERAEEKLREVLPEWLTADDVAEAVVWMLSRPSRVVINELVITPRGQAR